MQKKLEGLGKSMSRDQMKATRGGTDAMIGKVIWYCYYLGIPYPMCWYDNDNPWDNCGWDEGSCTTSGEQCFEVACA